MLTLRLLSTLQELLHDNVRKYGTVANTVAPRTDLKGVLVRAK